MDAALVRVALHTDDDLPSWPDLDGDTSEYVPGWRAWLEQAWKIDSLAEAVEAASPVLTRRVGDVCAGRVRQPRRVRRIVESVLRYVLRATSRATPFGWFAAVAPMYRGSAACVRWGAQHRPLTRPDAAWLADVIRGAQACGDVLGTVPVVANELSYARAGRWVVEGQRGTVQEDRVGDVSVRHTKAVQTALDRAQSPVPFSELADVVAARFPTAPRARVEAMLTELVSLRVLLPRLVPPMSVTAPLDHVAGELAAQSPEHPVVRQLWAVRRLLHRHDRACDPQARRVARTAAVRRMKEIDDGSEPLLSVDVRADCRAELPPAVPREAQVAASALVHLNPHPFGQPAWREYHQRFLQRYGIGAVVPLRQLVNPDTGLGYPAGYRDAPTPPPPMSDRDRTLLRWAQQATLDGSGEIVLDEDSLAQLTLGNDDDRPVYAAPHTELRFQVQATCLRALDRGDFTLTVVGAARQAGATVGRFLPAMDEPEQQRMAAALATLPTLTSGASPAQISCPPRVARADNIARAPAVLPTISLGEYRESGPSIIASADLAVSADAHRLFLIWLATGQVIEPLMLNAIELRRTAHPLARFLCEITTATAASCVPFDWTAASDLPYLPRVRYRRSVLRPATWRVAASELPGRHASTAQWARAWHATKRRYRIPDDVYLGETDVRMHLDLAEPAHRALLRSHLERAHHAVLTEAPTAEDFGWIEGRSHEIVLPLAAHQPPATSPPRSKQTTETQYHDGHLPGHSTWLYVKLYAHPERQTDILTTHMPTLWSSCGKLAQQWWFIRYHDPEPHLRVRARLPDRASYGAALAHLGSWAERLRHLGQLRDLTVETYYPEVGRYGTGTAMHRAEAAFATDSHVAVTQLALAAHGDADPYAVTAASLTDLAAAFTGSTDQGMRWLVEHVPHRPVAAPHRTISDQVMHLADPAAATAALPTASHGQLADAWQRRRRAVADYRRCLNHRPEPQPDTVLTSLLHMHHTRMFGVDRDTERRCLHLARAAALRYTARAASAPHQSTVLATHDHE